MLNFNRELDDEIVNTLITDTIGRRKKVINFIKLISLMQNNEIIALNGAWGSGKTIFFFFFELLINFINNYNENGEIGNEELKTNNLLCLKNIAENDICELNKIVKTDQEDLREYFEGNQTNCLYFNAWEYDNNKEPILSIIYKIINDFPYLSAHIENTDFKKMTATLDAISLFLSKGHINASEYISSEKLIEGIHTSEEIKIQINNLFDKLLEENSNKMIIIIDELDRCRPTYAIRLLEEIKHYIRNKDIIVILATNIQQLSNTIKNIYGYKFNVDEYLDKIIDMTFSLAPIDKLNYIRNLPLESNKRGSNWFTETIVAYVNYKKLEMRSINRFITLMKVYENHIYLKTSRYSAIRKILQYIFLPYCLGEQIFNSNNYNNFIKGNGYNEFLTYIYSSEKLQDIINIYLYQSTPKENRDLKRDLEKIYNAVYNQNQEYWTLEIGSIEIDKYDVEYYSDLCTMLSDFIMPENNNE